MPPTPQMPPRLSDFIKQALDQGCELKTASAGTLAKRRAYLRKADSSQIIAPLPAIGDRDFLSPELIAYFKRTLKLLGFEGPYLNPEEANNLYCTQIDDANGEED